ncbi:MAG: hypothetical protein V4753_08045 [Pseudomonadota bacterium]
MRFCSAASVLLAGFLTVGAASGQTPAPAVDPHHPAAKEETAKTSDADDAGQPEASTGDAGMGAMMPPEMMQMMMQMMAQHHPAGQMATAGMQPGMGAAMGMGEGAGAEVILGLAPARTEEMTPEKVRTWLQAQLDRLGNPRLALGAIASAEDGSITAEIRTVDGALVQKLAFNRYPGFVRQID